MDDGSQQVNKMKQTAFTICATNYIGLAKILKASIEKYCSEVDFHIIVSDEPTAEVRRTFPDYIHIAKDILPYSETKWREMAFKYNLPELCTAIKPATFLYLIEQGYEKCIYFDPDILAFSSIGVIFDELDAFDAVVSPHILEPETDYKGELDETRILFAGTFNLGFLALRRTQQTLRTLTWWSHKLEDFCFTDQLRSLFTDQAWADFLPSFLGNRLKISRSRGYNMALWNFHERRIEERNDGQLYVANRLHPEEEAHPLVFVHYSSFDYKAFLQGTLILKNDKAITEYQDLEVIFHRYRQALEEGEFAEYIDSAYTYANFQGTPYKITEQIRRLYRGYIEGSGYEQDPFSSDSSFYQKVAKRGLLSEDKGIVLESLEKVQAQSSGKILWLNRLWTLLYRLLGAKKYFLLTRICAKYSIWENHYFLIKRDTDSYHLRKF